MSSGLSSLEKLIAVGVISLFGAFVCDMIYRTPKAFPKRYEDVSFEQIFRGHYGYAIYSLDSNKRLIENFYQQKEYPFFEMADILGNISEFQPLFLDKHKRQHKIEVIKDLSNGSKSFLRILYGDLEKTPRTSFRFLDHPGRERDWKDQIIWIDVHMPKDRKISPGEELVGSSKSHYYQATREIK